MFYYYISYYAKDKTNEDELTLRLFLKSNQKQLSQPELVNALKKSIENSPNLEITDLIKWEAISEEEYKEAIK
ncbi:MAG TPA: hypothetical protein VG101_13015 [Puia sp.]|jgi:hypothetical protein|nr:hypothetical protein [Puia sp.]